MYYGVNWFHGDSIYSPWNPCFSHGIPWVSHGLLMSYFYKGASTTASPEIGPGTSRCVTSDVETEVESQKGGNRSRWRSWVRWRSTLLRRTNRGTNLWRGLMLRLPRPVGIVLRADPYSPLAQHIRQAFSLRFCAVAYLEIWKGVYFGCTFSIVFKF